MKIQLRLFLIVLMLSASISLVNAQDMNSDPEATDLKARVVSVTHELKNASFGYSVNSSNLQLTYPWKYGIPIMKM